MSNALHELESLAYLIRRAKLLILIIEENEKELRVGVDKPLQNLIADCIIEYVDKE